MITGDSFHITYCTNIHPGQDWETTFSALRSHLPRIRKSVTGCQPFGVGLRLSNKASLELASGLHLASFQSWLRDNGMYVFTLNGFPYGAFHHTAVKDQVHAPDWTQRERHSYTARLFEQLSYLLPQEMEGGISTSPISYRHWHKTESARKEVLSKGATQMASIATLLVQIERDQGTYLHLDIEPEPDGMLENTEDVLHFYSNYLIPEGSKLLKETLGVTLSEAEALLKRHITLCYDICHFALVYEDPVDVIETLSKEGIRIGKIQVSAALKADLNQAGLPDIVEALRPFDEPVYLHQVKTRTKGEVRSYPDLGDFLAKPVVFDELRSHFHVPIFMESYGVLKSTQDEVLKVLNLIKKRPVCRHLEVETYTWDVLPEDMKQELDLSISRELLWLKEVMAS